jgi:Flp pilus assembly protein TadG
MGVAALAVDVGILYHTKLRLMNMVDAAALAGARQLPESASQATFTADQFADSNGRQDSDNWSRTVGRTSVANDTITATVIRPVDMYFARALGINEMMVNATATAQVWPVAAVTGVVPFGVVWTNFAYGTTYSLKAGAGEGHNGNFGALALGDTGASNYRDNIKYGYPGKLEISEFQPLIVETEPGNMSGPTSTGVNYRINQDLYATFETAAPTSPRVVTVPVIESLAVNGRGEVRIIGFAAFFLERVGGSGQDNYVEGKFMRLVHPTATGGNQAGNYGLQVVRLIQ